MILKEKVALVTGSRGIGGACASLLAERDANVIVAFKQNQEAAEHLVATITKNGGISGTLFSVSRLTVRSAGSVRNVAFAAKFKLSETPYLRGLSSSFHWLHSR